MNQNNELIDLLEAIEEEEHEDKLRLRVENCGRYARFVDPYSGNIEPKKLVCGCYRTCEYCRESRAEKLKAQIAVALSNDEEICAVELPDDEADEFCNDLGKESFKRCPKSGGRSVVFYSKKSKKTTKNDNDRSVDVTDENIEEVVDWDELAYTPQDRRVSGGLGKSSSPEKTEGEEVVIQEIVTNAPYEVEQQAAEIAIEKTRTLNPKLAEELKEAINERQEAYKKAISGLGYKVLFTNKRKRMVEINRIDWLYSTIISPISHESGSPDPL